jgi:K+-transporting ATPase c subunit
MNQIKTTLKLFAILTILVGIIYPVEITALAQLFFPKEGGGKPSLQFWRQSHRFSLIGQPFQIQSHTAAHLQHLYSFKII